MNVHVQCHSAPDDTYAQIHENYEMAKRGLASMGYLNKHCGVRGQEHR